MPASRRLLPAALFVLLLVAGAVFLRYRSVGPTPSPARRSDRRRLARRAAIVQPLRGRRSLDVDADDVRPRSPGAAQSADSGHRPALATKWALDPDGRTYTITLRKRGVLGRHAVHGRRRRLHLPGPVRPEVGGPARQQPAGERTTPRRQEGRRPHRRADPAGSIWTWPASPEQPAHPACAQAARCPGEEAGFTKAWSTATPPAEIIGLGPYVIRSYTPGERIELARNPRVQERAGPTSSPRSSA